jgi:hypothetical protein
MKNFLGALFTPKVPLETGAPQLFDGSYAPDRRAAYFACFKKIHECMHVFS